MPGQIANPPAGLVDALRAKNAIAVVGAGLSQAAGGPSWKELLEGIAYEADQTRPNRRSIVAQSLKALWDDHPLLSANLLKSVLGPEFQRSAAHQIAIETKAEVDREAIEAVLGGKSADRLFGASVETPRLLRPTRSHQILTQLPFRGIVTTNYDCLLENSLPGGEIGVFSRSASRQLATSIQDNRRFILKLHGDVHNVNDIVLTREDYDDVLGDGILVSSLQALLRACKPFWIGYGLADPDLSLLLDETAKLGLSTGFALVRADNHALAGRLEIAQIFPSAIDSHLDTEAYLLRLAELSGTVLRMTLVLRVAWPGREQAGALAAPLVDELSDLVGERLRVESASAGSIVITVEGSAKMVRLLAARLRDRDPQLTALLLRHQVASFDGMPIEAPTGTTVTAVSAKGPPRQPIERVLGDGEVHPMALLSANVVKHGSFLKTNSKEDVGELLRGVRELVRQACECYGGDEIDWAGDDGVFAFWGTDLHTRAALAGRRVLLELALFNADPLRNPLALTVRLRTAASAGPVEFRLPTSSISSPALDLAKSLQQRGTAPDEFTVTDAVFSSCHQQVRTAFRYHGRFDGGAVYAFSLVPQRRPAREVFEALFQQLDAPVEELALLLQGVSASSAGGDEATFEAARSGIDQVYSALDDLYRLTRNLDENWSPAFFDYLHTSVDRCLGRERRLWETLEGLVVATDGPGGAENLPAFLHVAGSRRAALIPSLTRARNDLAGRAGQRDTSVAEQPHFMSRVQALIEAVDADKEKAFVELLRHGTELMEYLREPPSFAPGRAEQRKLLAGRLWDLADRLLLEEISDRRSGQPRLSGILEADRWVGDRFREVRRCLSSDLALDPHLETTLTGRLAGWPPEDAETFWRCLLIGHPAQRVRELAARTASMESVWWTIAYQKVRVSTLLTAAGRIGEAADGGPMMIFFDWTRARLEAEIKGAKDIRQLGGVRTLLLLFYGCDPFVRTSYFQRLDHLRRQFDDRLAALGVEDRLLRSAHDKAERARQDLGTSLADPPRPITSLPQPIQRWLAQDPNYFGFFVTHTIDTIAQESISYIDAGNVRRVLAFPEVNKMVLEWILNQHYFFSNDLNIVAMLMNAKCPPAFWQRYLPRLARNRALLERLAKGAPQPLIKEGAAKALAALKGE